MSGLLDTCKVSHNATALCVFLRQDLKISFQKVHGFELAQSIIFDLCTVCLEYMWVVSSQNFSSCTIPRLSRIKLRSEDERIQCRNRQDLHSQFEKSNSPKESTVSDEDFSCPVGYMSSTLRHTSSNELLARVTRSSASPSFFTEESYKLRKGSPIVMGSSVGAPMETELLSHESLCELDNVPSTSPSIGHLAQIRGVGISSQVAMDDFQKSMSSDRNEIPNTTINGSQEPIADHDMCRESPKSCKSLPDQTMEPVTLGFISQLEPGINLGDEQEAGAKHI